MAQHHQDFEKSVEDAVLSSESFLERNLRTILIVVGGVVVVGLAIFAYIRYVQEPKNEAASSQMYVAEGRFLEGQDSLALSGEGLSSRGFKAIAQDYSGTDAANLAEAYSGIVLYEQGKYKEALEALKAFSSKEKYVAPSLERLMGDCYVELGQLEEAARSFEHAAAMADNEAISPSCLVKAGHVYEKLGKKDKALELYNKVKQVYYTAPEADAVEADILRASTK